MTFATNTGEITFSLALTGDPQPMICTLGYRHASAPTQAMVNSFKASFGSWWSTRISSQYSISQAAMRWQQSADTQQWIASNTAPNVCLAAATPLPSNCAVIIQKKTGFGGKKHRGRFYIPGLPESTVDAHGNLTTVEYDEWVTRTNSTFGEFDALVDALVIHHNVLTVVDGKERWVTDPTQTPTTIESFKVAPKIGTQRRRMATRSFPLG